MKHVSQLTKEEVAKTDLKDLIHMGIIKEALHEEETSVSRRNFTRLIHTLSTMLNVKTIREAISITPNVYFHTFNFGYKSMISVYKLAWYVGYDYAGYHGKKDLKAMIYEGYKVYL